MVEQEEYGTAGSTAQILKTHLSPLTRFSFPPICFPYTLPVTAVIIKSIEIGFWRIDMISPDSYFVRVSAPPATDRGQLFFAPKILFPYTHFRRA